MNEQLIDIREAGGETYHIDTQICLRPAGSGAPGDQGIFIETEDKLPCL